MQAVILAAGQSKRFYPFTSFGHKSMVPMLGKPLLQHTLESLKKAKFQSVVIVVAKNSDIPGKIEKIQGLSITFVTQEEALGMGHALLQVETHLEETFFLLSGYHVDVADFAQNMQKLQKNPKDVVLLTKEDSIAERYGIVEVAGQKVLSIVEKPEKTEGKGLRVIGIYLLNKTFLQTLKGIPVEHYHFEKALDSFAKSGNIAFVKADHPTITLKHSWDLLTVKDYLLSKIKKSISSKAHIAKSAVIEGDVVISDDVKILEGACVKGPAFLGKGVIIGNNAILRNGIVAEEHAVIGATMETKNSFFMKHATTHSGYIGDSIIGEYSRLAGGICTANVRFDRGEITTKVRDVVTKTYRTHIGVTIGEYVDTGVHVTTMPGVCIGNHVRIGPGTTVMENIDDNSLLYTKFEIVVKKAHE